MDEKRYTISEAAEKMSLETHVLRYWEEELKLEVPRNEMGHRFYTEHEVTIFENIKLLKEQGLQLKAIKMALPNMDVMKDQYQVEVTRGSGINIADPNNDKVRQFQRMMKEMFREALDEYNQDFKQELKQELRHEIAEELDVSIKRQVNLEKERFRKLDEALREIQKMRQEIAAATPPKRTWWKLKLGI
jgi:DNA-binding transcriptional MerR regulator